MAFHTYISEGVDTAVIECGIGGEHDSTNILLNPTVTGITSLGIDHVAMLGNTIEEIAWHKSGIMKLSAAAFTAPQPSGAMAVLRQRAEEKDVDLHVVERHPQLDTIKLGLAADFQKTNASLAIAIAAAHLRALGHDETPHDSTTAPLTPKFITGLEQVQWPGRCEIRHEGNITWHIDGGHTLESIELAGIWFADQIQPPPTNSSSSPSSTNPNTSPPPNSPSNRKRKPILIFNQQTRSARPLALALYNTLSTALRTPHPFSHAIFCTNVSFQNAGFRPDSVSLNTNSEDVRQLSVQKELAQVWSGVDERCEVRVVRSVEEAVTGVRGLVGGGEGGDGRDEEGGEAMVLVTGSVHLVGGFLEVLASGENGGGAGNS